MDFAQLPTTAQAVVSVGGATILCVALTQWLKKYLPDWRFTNLMAFVVTLVLVEIGGIILGGIITERLYNGFLIALFGASLATFGYEAFSNLLGIAGIGSRK